MANLTGKIIDVTNQPPGSVVDIHVKAPSARVGSGTGAVVSSPAEVDYNEFTGELTITNLTGGLSWLVIEGVGWSDTVALAVAEGMTTLVEAIANAAGVPGISDYVSMLRNSESYVQQLANAAVEAEVGGFMVGLTGPNLLTTEGGTDGRSLGEDGTLVGAGDRWTSDFIPVESLTEYVWSHDGEIASGQQFTWQQYRADKTRIGGLRLTPAFTSDMNGAFVRVSILKSLVPVAQLEKGTTPTQYVVHGGLKSTDITIDGAGSVRRELSSIRALAESAATPASVDSKIAPLKTQVNTVAGEIEKLNGPNLLSLTGGQDRVTLGEDGTTFPVADRWTSDFIPVEKLTDYVWSRDGELFTGDQIIWMQYRSDKTRIGGLRVSRSFTSDTNGAFVRVSLFRDLVPVAQLEKGTEPTQYVAYGSLLAPDILVGGVSSLVKRLATLDTRITMLESNPSTPPVSGAKLPDSTLVWEEMPYNIRRIATAYDGNVYGQVWMDGAARLCRSTDSGETFEPGWPLGSLFGYTVVTWTVWEDGSVTAIGENGKFYRQDSFDTEPRLVFETTTGEKLHRLPASTYSDGAGKRYMLAAEYSSGPTQKNVYYSLDAGETWDLLKEGDTDFTGNNHWHATHYDPYRDAIWLSQGDGTNSRLYVTFDWGQTWHSEMRYQPTSIFAFPDRVTFGRDEDFLKPGITGTDGTLPLELHDDLTFRPDVAAYHFYPNGPAWNKMDDEYYLLFHPHLPDEANAYIWATGDGAKSWHPVYVGPDAKSGLTGVDKNGYLFATSNDTGLVPLLRAKAVGWRDV